MNQHLLVFLILVFVTASSTFSQDTIKMIDPIKIDQIEYENLNTRKDTQLVNLKSPVTQPLPPYIRGDSLKGMGGNKFLQYGSPIAYNGGNVGIGNSGIQRNLYVDGNVGIGISNPQNELHIHDDLTTGFQLTNNNSGTKPRDGLWLGMDKNLDTYIVQRENASLRFLTNESIRMLIDKTGNVGIGKFSPNERLDVKGNINTSGSYYIGNSNTRISRSNSGSLSFTDPQTGTVTLSQLSKWTNNGSHIAYNAGNVGIGTSNPQNELHIHDDLTTGFQLTNNNSGTTPRDGLWLGMDKNLDTYLAQGENASLRFLTNASIRVLIDKTGNVGIGKFFPNERLDVKGNINTSGAFSMGDSTTRISRDASGNLTFTDTPTGTITLSELTDSSPWTNNGSHIAYTGGNVGIGVTSPIHKLHISQKHGTIQLRLHRTGSNAGFSDIGSDGNGLYFWVGGYDHKAELFINPTGYLGLGTTNPLQKLDVKGNIITSGSYYLGNSNTSISRSNSGSLSFTDPLIGTVTLSQLANSGQWKNNGSHIAYTGGNVAIGNSGIQRNLHVNGNVYAKLVNVELSVPAPDYVFEEGYALMGLSKLENYLATHKHLPEMPSAKEMEEEGVDLAKMNMLLLKKVEELTLYILEQEKNMSLQKKEFESRFEKLEEFLSK